MLMGDAVLLRVLKGGRGTYVLMGDAVLRLVQRLDLGVVQRSVVRRQPRLVVHLQLLLLGRQVGLVGCLLRLQGPWVQL